MILAEDLGFKADDISFDNALIWKAVMPSVGQEVRFGKGTYSFLTPIGNIDYSIYISGLSMSATVLRCEWQLATYEGFIKLTGGMGSRISNLSIIKSGGVLGCGLVLESQASGPSPDFFRGENLNITCATSGAMWQIPLWLNGVGRANKPLSGLRDINITGTLLFCASEAALYINTVHQADLEMAAFPAWGLTDKVVFTAWASDKNNRIILRSGRLGNVQLWNTVDSVLLASAYGTVDRLGLSNVKTL